MLCCVYSRGAIMPLNQRFIQRRGADVTGQRSPSVALFIMYGTSRPIH